MDLVLTICFFISASICSGVGSDLWVASIHLFPSGSTSSGCAVAPEHVGWWLEQRGTRIGGLRGRLVYVFHIEIERGWSVAEGLGAGSLPRPGIPGPA